MPYKTEFPDTLLGLSNNKLKLREDNSTLIFGNETLDVSNNVLILGSEKPRVTFITAKGASHTIGNDTNNSLQFCYGSDVDIANQSPLKLTTDLKVQMPLITNYASKEAATTAGLVNGDLYETNGNLNIVSSNGIGSALIFCQCTNTLKSNIAHGNGIPENDDVPTDVADWGQFDTWTSTGALNPYSLFTLGTSGITIQKPGYYRVSCSIFCVSETSNSRCAVLGRFAKNNTMEGPVTYSYVRFTNSFQSGQLKISHIIQCATNDVISIFTTRADNNSDNIHVPADYSQLRIELVTS